MAEEEKEKEKEDEDVDVDEDEDKEDEEKEEGRTRAWFSSTRTRWRCCSLFEQNDSKYHDFIKVSCNDF